jgi:hypothetical protein
MDKKDIMYVVAALGIILIVAIFIKPLTTGQPINTGIPVNPTEQPSVIIYSNASSTLQTTGIPATILTTPLPTTSPVPTWDQNVTGIVFVDPSNYNLSATPTLGQSTRINEKPVNTSMVTFATISGKYGGTTQTINVPFPYWELSYTINPETGPMSGQTAPSIAVTPTLGQGSSYSGIQGSYASVMPVFTIQVMDATDPNRIVKTITPPGGIDPNLWIGITQATPEVTRVSKYAEIAPTPTFSSIDPRPWTVKFFEGHRNYFFVINTRYIESYKIDLRVPANYVGKY